VYGTYGVWNLRFPYDPSLEGTYGSLLPYAVNNIIIISIIIIYL
jgi:hypothetical protein